MGAAQPRRAPGSPLPEANPGRSGPGAAGPEPYGPRVPGSLRWPAVPQWRGILVTAAGTVVVDGALWMVAEDTFAALPPAYWAMAVLAVAVDARPYVLANRRASSVVLPSICFTFAIALAWGFLPAVAAQLVAVTVAGVRMRRPVRRVPHLAVQHAGALAGASLVAAATGLRLDPAPHWDDAVLTVAAAAAWIGARYGLAALAAQWRSEGGRPRHHERRGVELFATAALLLLGPVVLAAAQVGLVLVPLVLLALHAVHRMVRSAGEYERAARIDALTGLPNRRSLAAAVAEGSGEGGVRRPQRQLALLLLDLDRFRNVNDALGHPRGDRLLVEVADRLAAAVPTHDLLVRLGGDEFAVLATRVDGPTAARAVAGHLAEVLNRPFHLDGLAVDVSATIGIALRAPAPGGAADPGDAATLLRQAEAAMYDAKQRGDQIAVYGPDAAHHSPERLTLLADLRCALREHPSTFDPPPGSRADRVDPSGVDPSGTDPSDIGSAGVGSAGMGSARMRSAAGAAGPAGPADDGIQLFYQPQIAIATGEVVGVEALLRWQHPRRGLVGAEELIRVAEQTPVMRLLTARVLHEVVAQLAAWQVAGRPVRAAVNVSVRDLHSAEIAERVDGLLRRYGVPASLLQLEITESALMADPHRVLTTITRLDRMGVAISLDDFGTGYSSLQHLRRLPLSEVKIDRSFVLGMVADRGDAAIVRSVIDLAEALRLRVVAEGVEDESTWRMLARVGCHAAQGWFHARPMPADDLLGWLARYRPLRPVPTT
ncbi:putative bifunctional diguanylate cyclase/phosphodiesterase [Krasilnikovia sp. MM14-A1004]|uniref:putative bifunctional diguanylate cyclase/phosphodiesterase n=1 Tax=Krasilnikovia sp. MM14-A1004 TaxID=3373541 RepID=UPI00399D4836